jgi:hypothetical protein
MKKGMKIEINLTNKWLYSLIVVVSVLLLGVGVWAYQNGMMNGQPSVVGHSAGEIEVELNGENVNLQTAINNLASGSSGGDTSGKIIGWGLVYTGTMQEVMNLLFEPFANLGAPTSVSTTSVGSTGRFYW